MREHQQQSFLPTAEATTVFTKWAIFWPRLCARFFASATPEDITGLPCTKVIEQSSACAAVRGSQGASIAGHTRKEFYGLDPAALQVLATRIEQPRAVATKSTSVAAAAAQVHATASEAGKKDSTAAVLCNAA